mmetsp:Transcript_9649/g.16568  ORF Transcript_9649/g.16568 Transcript_9649/m.16568 type:complete len:311 (+) Transcript_9649:80-1012(+)|eukprot:CAMPEP_0198222434 /NCGR_PEP_ID=MMETSP1445-20131203/88066_1 /TAXON_ID=36898 /ORGANISM="Pyramimonas sp., Strain CCMP2087" /LENGTH=310 /DNA_ID=CAMNT_0043900941 /DNA_START=66 /DNA_END=998 /DNA_ORIENTATION=+
MSSFRNLSVIALIAFVAGITPAKLQEAPQPEVSVLIATPCYGGLVYESFYMSVVRTLMYYRNSPNVFVHASTVPGIADLPKARGALIYEFLSKPYYTHLLFVDADIEFSPHLIERVARSGKDVACVIYPKKAIQWDGIQRAAALGGRQVADLDTLKSMGLNYPVEWEFESSTGKDQGSVKTDKNGFARVKRAGAGFMMISREAILKMRTAYPELSYMDLTSKQIHYAFFHTVLESSPQTGGVNAWISEDFAFCDRWSALGGEIWVDLLSGLNHTGTFKYEGKEWLQRYSPSNNNLSDDKGDAVDKNKGEL